MTSWIAPFLRASPCAYVYIIVDAANLLENLMFFFLRRGIILRLFILVFAIMQESELMEGLDEHEDDSDDEVLEHICLTQAHIYKQMCL
jgi:hypothetical protein